MSDFLYGLIWFQGILFYNTFDICRWDIFLGLLLFKFEAGAIEAIYDNKAKSHIKY